MLEFCMMLIICMEYIIPLVVIALLLGCVCLVYYIKFAQQQRKIDLLQSNGFERYLKGVPAYGNGDFYEWRNERQDIRIDERDLAHMSYKELKDKIKQEG